MWGSDTRVSTDNVRGKALSAMWVRPRRAMSLSAEVSVVVAKSVTFSPWTEYTVWLAFDDARGRRHQAITLSFGNVPRNE